MTKCKKVLALVGEDAPEYIKTALSELGFLPRSLPRDDRLAIPVRSHADMLLLPIGNTLFTSREYYENARSIFCELEELGYEVIACDVNMESEYPHDVAFDALVLKNAIIARLDSLPDEVKTYSADMGISLIGSKQGYAKCSAVRVSESAIITADKNIAKEAEAAGADVLRVSPDGSIRLEGYDLGFIGGSSGVFEDTVYFTGSLSHHPDKERIEEFCKAHGKKIIPLSKEPLCDVGGIFFFPRVK